MVKQLIMKRGIQAKIAKKVGISDAYLSALINRKKFPSRTRAKELAEATGTDPILWLYGTKEEIKQALSGCPERKDRDQNSKNSISQTP